MGLTESEEAELLRLLEQEERERVSPKLESFRKPCRIKLARGGRGAGAKSWGVVSLLVQLAQVRPIRVACLREIQGSLADSVFQLIVDTVNRLQYTGWTFTKEYIASPVGARFIFRGLKDLRAANQIKSLEGYDIFFLEEAATISMESLNLVLPTLRKEGSELWAVYNPITETDPITVRLWNSDRQDVLKIELKPGAVDNPWWTDALQQEMEEHFRLDPDEAEHVWHGLPRRQGERSIMSRLEIRSAMDRIVQPGQLIEFGVDVARFGDDKTVVYRRRGMLFERLAKWAKLDTQEIALRVWDLANRDRNISIKVDDTGVGGGVTDRLRQLGAKVVPINFGASPTDKNKYTSVADEMWFTFPINDAQIPNDMELMEELSGRQYTYTNDERRKVEPKEGFKKRIGRSPDDADALLMCGYSPRRMSIPAVRLPGV